MPGPLWRKQSRQGAFPWPPLPLGLRLRLFPLRPCGFGFGERTFGLPQSCSGLKLLRLSLACRGLERGKRRRFTGGVGLSNLDLGLAARNVGGNPVERSFHVLILDPVPEGFVRNL